MAGSFAKLLMLQLLVLWEPTLLTGTMAVNSLLTQCQYTCTILCIYHILLACLISFTVIDL